DRKMFENVLLRGLQSNYQPAVKGFLMEQLELIGSEQSIPVLKSFLGDKNLHKSAVHALRSINTRQAQQTLVQALTSTQGSKQAAIIKTLGDMQATTAASDVLPFASADDWPTQKAALYALAQTGDPVAVAPLTAAVDEYEGYKNTVAESYYLLLAEGLAEEGHQEESAELSR